MAGDFFHADLLRELRAAQFAISTSSVAADGLYNVEDVFWNYLDTQHTDVVHTSVIRHAPFFVTRNSLSSLLVMKYFAVPVPIILTQYFVDDSTLHTVQSLPLGMLLLSTIHMIQTTPDRTRIEITYHVATSRWLKWLHAMVHGALRRNFRQLLDEDEPMRIRKAELRRLGFVNVSGSSSNYLKTLNIGENNIRFDRSRALDYASQPEVALALDDITASGQPVRLDNQKQFRVLRTAGEALVFQAYCPHEGADLLDAPCREGRLVCPWHGRKVGPLAKVPLDRDGRVEIAALETVVTCADGRLSFTHRGER